MPPREAPDGYGSWQEYAEIHDENYDSYEFWDDAEEYEYTYADEVEDAYDGY